MNIDIFISHHTKSSLHIVEAIVNRLESIGIRCWYAPRDTHGEYASDIYRAINNCKIFLLILNKAASESFDVLNEINIACDRLRKNEEINIIPFHIADSDISEDALYYLGRIHWLDALTPPIYERIEELVVHLTILLGQDPKQEIKNVQNHYCLTNNVPQVRDIFEGRDKLITNIEKIFSEGKHILFLEGIGGIGKSELAKQYAIKNSQKYKTIVFAPYTTNLETLICDDNIFLIENLDPKKDYESDEDYYNRKLLALKQCCSKKTLLIIDNFDVDSDVKLHDLTMLDCDIIITTRNIHLDYPVLKVGTMKNIDILYNIFEQHYGDPLNEDDKPYLTEIFRLVEYHTYTIELIAKQMSASFLTASEMLVVLKEGIANAPQEYFYSKGSANSAFGHLKVLFNIGQLNEAEQQIMRYLSITGTSGIKANIFKQWSGITSFDIINTLINRSWIHRKEGQKIALHPMITEIVWEQLNPNEENCNVFLQNMAQYLYYTWHRTYKENLEIRDNITAIVKYFSNPDVTRIEFFEPIGSYMWQVGKFDEAIKYTQSLYDACITQVGPNTIEAGIMAKSLGGCYFNSGHLEESIVCYKRGLQHMLDSKMPDSEDLALSYEKVARCYTWEYIQDFDKAEELFKKSLEIRFRILNALKHGEERPRFASYAICNIPQTEVCIAACHMEMGRMYQAKGDYTKALEYTEKYQVILMEQTPDNLASLSFAYFDKGVSYYEIGKKEATDGNMDEAFHNWETAKSHMIKALECNLKMRGDLALETVKCQEMLGDICTAMNQYSEASNAYMAALDMARKLLGDKNERVSIIMDKMKI